MRREQAVRTSLLPCVTFHGKQTLLPVLDADKKTTRCTVRHPQPKFYQTKKERGWENYRVSDIVSKRQQAGDKRHDLRHFPNTTKTRHNSTWLDETYYTCVGCGRYPTWGRVVRVSLQTARDSQVQSVSWKYSSRHLPCSRLRSIHRGPDVSRKIGQPLRYKRTTDRFVCADLPDGPGVLPLAAAHGREAVEDTAISMSLHRAPLPPPPPHLGCTINGLLLSSSIAPPPGSTAGCARSSGTTSADEHQCPRGNNCVDPGDRPQ